jgi:hypothetical protein
MHFDLGAALVVMLLGTKAVEKIRVPTGKIETVDSIAVDLLGNTLNDERI